jgi:hypothetical protein
MTRMSSIQIYSDHTQSAAACSLQPLTGSYLTCMRQHSGLLFVDPASAPLLSSTNIPIERNENVYQQH